ncbi:hypothetical protein B5E56_06865 [Flavonifractor sp. An112]|uniref:LuxR C-terminal-related transcriptional regulator n=1 Tax=Flavonifractor sp. An112 TaxID=1965544 RepID=UPI000B36711D|nr:LuxR C-terminal-related transcriptional regulator [Flavonifractor sp. An112]OUQ60151.1 hypothetical protein B5E56_06865 [Flavonifractor sp. An112]
MTDYLSIREAAEQWGVSERRVNQFCADGRIEGARKIGGSWVIPADAKKPSDPRKQKKQEPVNASAPTNRVWAPNLLPLMNTAFLPGHCAKCIEAMNDGTQKKIAMAEYYYFSGQPELAVREVQLYLTSPDMGARLSACVLYAYANLSIGQIQRARFALSEVNKALIAGSEKMPQLRAASAFVAAVAAVLLHLPLPESLPPTREFLPLLPPGLRAFALYVEAHYLYLQGEYEKSAGVVEATLAMQGGDYPIPAIYLHLVAVMDYMSLKQAERAKAHLLSAWELARPDDLIEGFGEHHGLLGGMLEAVIKKEWPEDFKRIIAITYRFSAGWRKIHNPDTGHDVADNLTTTEFAAAMLAARGWTNQEISAHMNISPNTVKRHISTALQKLNINNRQDLKKYMLR